MTLHKPYPISADPGDSDDPEWYDGEELRQLQRSYAELSHGFVGTRRGVHTLASFAVTQRGAGPTMSVDVAPGRGWFYGDDSTFQGVYWGWSDATVNVPVPVTSSGTRTHRIVQQLRDKSELPTWPDYGHAPILVQDTGGGIPTLPPSCFSLALVQVASGDVSVLNAKITDLRETYQRYLQVTRATDATARASTTTTTDDDTLVLSNLAIGSWAIRALIFYNGGTAGDFSWKFRTPPGYGGGYTVMRALPDPDAGTYANNPARCDWNTKYNAQAMGPTKPTNSLTLDIRGKLVVPSTDTVVSGGGILRQLAFQWAQQSSASIGCQVEADSFMIAERIN